MAELRHFTLDAETRGLRLDQALARLAPDHSRSFLAGLIEAGLVSIDGRKVTKPSQRLPETGRLTVEIPPARPTDVGPQELPLTVLYQDDDLAVIDKPAGLVVHPATGHHDSTMVNALLFHLQGLSGVGGELRPGIVHRLDKDTSGVMVVAKNDAAHRRLAAEWGTDRVAKEYIALVYGTPKELRGSIEKPIGRDPRNRKRMAVVSGGRKARTDYEVLEGLRYVSLLRCRLRTGRTHQIRVHLKALGHPLVGDPVYSGPQWRGVPDKKLQKVLSAFPRQALHAATISFPHPRSGELVRFEAPLPADFQRLLDALR